MKHIFFKVITCALFLFCVLPLAAKKPIKALLITGQNNHYWQGSYPLLTELMENSGYFTVDVAQSPAHGESMDQFILDFTPYDLVVLDYNGDAWPETTNQNFLNFVKKGGGVVVYHAADNAFPNWKEYNEIIALGGWEGRNEKSGPWVYWKDGGLVKDYSPGAGGSHGERYPYTMTCRNTSHPITKGLPTEWMHFTDELYDRMRGPGNIKTLLYTASSDATKGGSGREEPLMFTVDFGKGRIFHTMLGHVGPNNDHAAVECVGFQVTFLRGCEWAATGKVTQKIPDNFPTATQTSTQKIK
ncbi:MAG: ThuA domain-containing protein [Bacteroidales bacterium]|nr:ThuA domain-containing protein [Bacteroidales bacterium]